MVPLITPKAMSRLKQTSETLSQIKPKEKKGKLTVSIKKDADNAPNYRMMQSLGYEYMGEKRGKEIYDKPMEGEPTAKNTKVKLRPGQSPNKFFPKGEGWETRQEGNKIILTRKQKSSTESPSSASGRTISGPSYSEMTEEQRKQERGGPNQNPMQYRDDATSGSSSESQRFVIKMKPEKGSDGGSSTTGKERRASRRAGCEIGSKSKTPCNPKGKMFKTGRFKS